jgi:diguanylate cyclase (GGDEF)-like protein
MSHRLRVLNLEDDSNDSELIQAQLAKLEMECGMVRVETREEFVAAMERGGFDLILADYSLPSFNGLYALEIARKTRPEVPFIFVSGAIGEEFAIETLKSGATDYVLKDRLSRLPTAIERALKGAEERIKLWQAEEALKRSHEELERNVEDRTAELVRTNEILQAEIVERKKLEEKLRTASITDELTGLLNRRGFLIIAQKQVDIAKRAKRNFSILYMDLNEMKKINDEFGHKEGDQALLDIATILKKTYRASDSIARMGGDEFIVLITEPHSSTIEKTVAQHIQDNLRIHNQQTEKGYRLAVSMGMVHYDPERPCSLEELLARADELMYEHKLGLVPKKEIPSSIGGKREERGYERYKIDNNSSAELVLSGSAMIRNISIGGILVRTSQRLTKNTIYTIKMLNNNNEELSPKGLVVWSSLIGKANEKDKTEPYYEAGLRFIERGLISDGAQLAGAIPPPPRTVK